jgi:hypothetical protein
MQLRIHEHVEIEAPRQAVFDHTIRPENFGSFEGFGPIPGIRSATYVTHGPVGVGSRRRVLNTDGSEHSEEITHFEAPRRHNSRIFDIRPPFALIVRFLEDDWIFEDSGDRTRIQREFRIDARPLALPIAVLLLPLLRRAVRRDLDNIRRALEPQTP